MTRKKILVYLRAMRVNQWVKNLVVFTAVIFSGKLFEVPILLSSIYAFFVFCLLSSTSYVLNDIIDKPYDQIHAQKRRRPIASGEITIAEALFLVFILTFISLMVSLLFSVEFFLLAFIFILLHFFYSLYLKRYPLFDLFAISFSFMIRAFAGEVVSKYHIPIWLLLTIFFISLFMASVKRQAELVVQGSAARISLASYREHLLNFLTTTFATATIIAYSFYTYFEKPPQLADVFGSLFPTFEARKWMMATIPLVVFGLARYAQLLFDKEQGERPEQIITTDIPLIITVFLWGALVIGLIYLF
ncbi:UbiA prenyltransferase family protein [Candidatus Roizmanbacteria bacterium]|nr:UbiA prenyltransferase family protein [Candidatus Roizmanbacteria bacterium]